MSHLIIKVVVWPCVCHQWSHYGGVLIHMKLLL